jgi:hypothetical protein
MTGSEIQNYSGNYIGTNNYSYGSNGRPRHATRPTSNTGDDFSRSSRNTKRPAKTGSNAPVTGPDQSMPAWGKVTQRVHHGSEAGVRSSSNSYMPPFGDGNPHLQEYFQEDPRSRAHYEKWLRQV